MRGMHEDILAIPSKIEEMLQQRQMAGPLSLAQITERIENGPNMKAMQEDLAFLKNHLLNGNTGISAAVGGGVSLTNRPTPRHNMRLFKQYNHSGKYRRVPSTWKFPTLPLQNMYVYWHCGDDKRGVFHHWSILSTQTLTLFHVERRHLVRSNPSCSSLTNRLLVQVLHRRI